MKEIKAIMGIRTDDHTSIALKIMKFTDESEILYLTIEDGGDGASFFFDNATEAHTFAKRLLDQAYLYMEN